MLRVVGESMIEAGIHHNDYVIVKQQPTANNGDIVVAMTEDDEATVKTFYKERDHIRLQPENPSMDPIRLRNVTILGKVIGLFRDIH
jgi:repressor LexA